MMWYLVFIFFITQASAVFAQMSPEEGMPESQWELTVDVIKAKAKDLLTKNNELSEQSQAIKSQLESLSASIKDQNEKNQTLRQFLKERNGRNDSQMQIDDLNVQIKAHRLRLTALNRALSMANKEVADMDRKVKLKKLKLTEIQLHQTSKEVEGSLKKALDSPDVSEGELSDVRKQLEDAKSQEVSLEHELETLKASSKQNDLNTKALENENVTLSAELERLTVAQQKSAAIASEYADQGALSTTRYHEMQAEKAKLEAKIHDFELKIDALKDPSMFATSWPVQKKRLVHDIVQADARNNDMRGKIDAIREDIGILQDQIGRLERRVNFMQGQGLRH